MPIRRRVRERITALAYTRPYWLRKKRGPAWPHALLNRRDFVQTEVCIPHTYRATYSNSHVGLINVITVINVLKRQVTVYPMYSSWDICLRSDNRARSGVARSLWIRENKR